LIFIQRSVCDHRNLFQGTGKPIFLFLNNSREIFIIKMVIVCRFNKIDIFDSGQLVRVWLSVVVQLVHF